MTQRPPTHTLFPYTTLFRSVSWSRNQVARSRGAASGSSLLKRSQDRKSTRLNSSHQIISYVVFCLKKKNGTNCEYSSTVHKTYKPIKKCRQFKNFKVTS